MNVDTSSEEAGSRADSRWDLIPGKTSIFFPSLNSGFLWISPDILPHNPHSSSPLSPMLLWVARIVTPSQNLYLCHHHIVFNQNEVCLSATASHMQPARTPKGAGPELDQPAELSLPASYTANICSCPGRIPFSSGGTWVLLRSRKGGRGGQCGKHQRYHIHYEQKIQSQTG